MLGAPDMAGMAGDAVGKDIGVLLGQVASGGGGGGVLLAIVGFVRSKMG
jgi:tetrahydromethanopterin S-methyltransferase subunit G